MKIEIERTENGIRSIHLLANDITQSPATIRAWIRMLQTALRWLEDRDKKK